MRILCSILLFVACSAPPTPSVPISACPQLSCPSCQQVDCPTCPQTRCPGPLQPVASDWHCFDVHHPNGQTSDYCWPLAEVCKSKRQSVLTRKRNEVPSPCITQPTAYCVRITDAHTLKRQLLCTRTASICEESREKAVAHLPSETNKIGECRPTLNTDSFTD